MCSCLLGLPKISSHPQCFFPKLSLLQCLLMNTNMTSVCPCAVGDNWTHVGRLAGWKGFDLWAVPMWHVRAVRTGREWMGAYWLVSQCPGRGNWRGRCNQGLCVGERWSKSRHEKGQAASGILLLFFSSSSQGWTERRGTKDEG